MDVLVDVIVALSQTHVLLTMSVQKNLFVRNVMPQNVVAVVPCVIVNSKK